MTGIERVAAERDAAARASTPKSHGVTINMILQMYASMMHASDERVMLFAAAALAMAGGLRPSELLGGSSQHARERALTVDQLVFYSDRDGTVEMVVTAAGSDAYANVMPDHCVLTLLVSKTNQLRVQQPIEIAAPTVVTALWRWRQIRGVDYARGRKLFHLAGHSPLRTPTLIAQVQLQLRS